MIYVSINDNNRKFLGTLGVRKNDAPPSHIHDRPYHEFNEWTPS